MRVTNNTKCACADKLRQKFNMADANAISHARISSCFMHFEGVTEQLCQVSRQRLKKFIECRHKWAKLDCVQADIAKSSYNKFDDDFVNGLLHLIPVPPLSRTSFSKGEISHFFQRGNWEKWKKNALSRGVKKQKCTSRGGSSLFQRGQLHRFFCIPEG